MEQIDPFADTCEIKPRPVEEISPLPEPPSLPIVSPEPREIAPRGVQEEDGFSESEILLESIRIVASKPRTPVTTAAMRNLIAKFSSEFSLDF
jgi:hypothetical protein